MHSKTLSADVASTAAAAAATDVVASIVPSGIGKPRERAKAKASSAQFSSEGGHHHRHTANKCRVKSKVANEGRLARDDSKWQTAHFQCQYGIPGQLCKDSTRYSWTLAQSDGQLDRPEPAMSVKKEK